MESTEKLFGRVFKNYDAWFKKDPAYMALVGFIAQRAAELKPARILDAGTGTGNLAEAILGKHTPEKYVGIDNTEEMIEKARKKLSRFGFVEIENKRIQDLDADAEFDCIVSNYALHHLTHEEKEQFCRQAYRALTDNGTLIYGDVFINKMGDVDDPERAKDVLEIFNHRAAYYMEHVGFERAIFEVEHIPYCLREEREFHATPEFWKGKLLAAGFNDVEVHQPCKEMPCDRAIIAVK
ncbi:MAG: class I SAM-dependent methyltransferase [Candidatus Diapherotrites archaeon]